MLRVTVYSKINSHYLGTINTVMSTKCVYTYAHVYMCLHLQQGEGSLHHLVEGGSQEHHLQGDSQQEEGSPGERMGEKEREREWDRDITFTKKCTCTCT